MDVPVLQVKNELVPAANVHHGATGLTGHNVIPFVVEAFPPVTEFVPVWESVQATLRKNEFVIPSSALDGVTGHHGLTVLLHAARLASCAEIESAKELENVPDCVKQQTHAIWEHVHLGMTGVNGALAALNAEAVSKADYVGALALANVKEEMTQSLKIVVPNRVHTGSNGTTTEHVQFHAALVNGSVRESAWVLVSAPEVSARLMTVATETVPSGARGRTGAHAQNRAVTEYRKELESALV